MQALQGRLRGSMTPGLSSGEKTAPAQPGGPFRNGVWASIEKAVLSKTCDQFQSPLRTGYAREFIRLSNLANIKNGESQVSIPFKNGVFASLMLANETAQGDQFQSPLRTGYGRALDNRSKLPPTSSFNPL